MNVLPGRHYLYSVTAVNRAGNESPASAPASANLPEANAPANIQRMMATQFAINKMPSTKMIDTPHPAPGPTAPAVVESVRALEKSAAPPCAPAFTPAPCWSW